MEKRSRCEGVAPLRRFSAAARKTAAFVDLPWLRRMGSIGAVLIEMVFDCSRDE
jgi:hypothetical protein